MRTYTSQKKAETSLVVQNRNTPRVKKAKCVVLHLVPSPQTLSPLQRITDRERGQYSTGHRSPAREMRHGAEAAGRTSLTLSHVLDLTCRIATQVAGKSRKLCHHAKAFYTKCGHRCDVLEK